MSKPHLLVTGNIMKMIPEKLAADFEVHSLIAAPDREAMLAQLGPKIEVVAHGGHGPIRVDGKLMDRLPKLRIVSNFGVGYDGVDAVEAGRRGIVVTNTPDVLTEEVADTALGLLLMTVRELGKAEQYLRAGKWATGGDYPLTPLSLRDRTVGIVGLGRIGKAIARRCEAFGLKISYYGRSKQKDVAYPYFSDVAALAAAVDTMIVVTPGTAETKNLINAKVLEALGPNGVLINIARGSVVDETALKAALRARTIAMAGLDVMWNEPKIDPDLMTIDNLVLLPHVGSASIHTRNLMGQLVVDNACSYVKKTPPLTPVAETPFKGW